MENQNVSAKQVMINYGLILGVIGIILNLALYATGRTYDPHWSFMVIAIGVSIGALILGIKKFKDENNGLLKLGEAIKIGLGIALISGIIGVVYTLIFANFIELNHYELLVDSQMEKVLETNPDMDEDQMDATRKIYETMSGAAIGSAVGIAISLFSGFIVSLIGGLIMKKTDEEITSI